MDIAPLLIQLVSGAVGSIASGGVGGGALLAIIGAVRKAMAK